MENIILISPDIGTVCPNGARITGKNASKQGDRRTESVDMKKTVRHLLTDFTSGEVLTEYGELEYELIVHVDVTSNGREMHFNFDVQNRHIRGPRHPHMNGGTICLGDNPPVWRGMLTRGMPCYRLMDEVEAMLKFYDGPHAYFRIRGGSDTEHCEDCGCEVNTEDGDDYMTDRYGPLCSDCYWQRYTSCERCGDHLHRDSDSYNTVDGETWCETCTDNHAYWCDECDEYSSEKCNEHPEEDE